jgi:glutathione-independent formaldehyde dehydrogenase
VYRRTGGYGKRERKRAGGVLIAGNKAVAYMGDGKVEVQTIDYPELELKDAPASIRTTWGARRRTG